MSSKLVFRPVLDGQAYVVFKGDTPVFTLMRKRDLGPWTAYDLSGEIVDQDSYRHHLMERLQDAEIPDPVLQLPSLGQIFEEANGLLRQVDSVRKCSDRAFDYMVTWCRPGHAKSFDTWLPYWTVWVKNIRLLAEKEQAIDQSSKGRMSPQDALALAKKIDIEGFKGLAAEDITAALRHMASLIQQAPTFFSPEHDFNGEKLKWLQSAQL